MATTGAETEAAERVLYEVCLLYSLLQQKDEQQLLKNIDQLFSEASAKLVSKDNWGKRGIAYRIQGNTEGNYVVYHYEIDPVAIRELDRMLRIEKNVLRHLIVKPPKGYVIEKWSGKYEKWLKERETLEQKKVREQETKLQERIALRAKQQVKRSDDAKRRQAETVARPMKEGELEEKLEKLISDDSLDL